MVAQGGGYWVAAGSGANNTLRYNTTDPTTAWSGSTSGLDGTTTFLGLDYGNGIFVAVTSDDEIITTANPASGWSLAGGTPAFTNQNSLRFRGDRFYITSSDAGVAYTSSNGTTWSSVVFSATDPVYGSIFAVALDSSSYLYIAVSTNSGAGTAVLYSTDGINFNGEFSVGNTSTIALNITGGRTYYDPTSRRLYFTDSNNDMNYSQVFPELN